MEVRDDWHGGELGVCLCDWLGSRSWSGVWLMWVDWSRSWSWSWSWCWLWTGWSWMSLTRMSHWWPTWSLMGLTWVSHWWSDCLRLLLSGFSRMLVVNHWHILELALWLGHCWTLWSLLWMWLVVVSHRWSSTSWDFNSWLSRVSVIDDWWHLGLLRLWLWHWSLLRKWMST